MDFAESTEQRALRAAVAEIARDFGPRYYAEHAAERRPCAELWKALGEAGFIGVNIPETYGGGGGGLTELGTKYYISGVDEAEALLVVAKTGQDALSLFIVPTDAEYGLMPYWGLARLTRIAPVNREMILNFAAQHSLGLPRSY